MVSLASLANMSLVAKDILAVRDYGEGVDSDNCLVQDKDEKELWKTIF
jgi:hypothetical protein